MKQNDASPRIDPGLFFLRLTGSLLLLYVHGLPKVLHFSEELTRIEDPFGFGPYASLIPAIVAEVICPLFIIAGVYTRLACLPIIAVLLVAMLAVHPNWSIAEGQFGWLLLIIFTTLALTGPGRASGECSVKQRRGSHDPGKRRSRRTRRDDARPGGFTLAAAEPAGVPHAVDRHGGL